jgi:hypothetical protein
MAVKSLKERQQANERALEEVVARTLRDNLVPLQRTADELQQAYADLVAACSSSRPSNALPAMLRAQTAAAALAAGLSVLSNFVAVALKPREESGTEAAYGEVHAASGLDEPEAPPVRVSEDGWAEVEQEVSSEIPLDSPVVEAPVVSAPPAAVDAPAFDISTLPTDLQELHRRANRVAKVAMQDIKLLRPKEVHLGRENKDICIRLRTDLDKARKEYDRRFRTIQDHPIDYFHHWMVEILGEGDPAALGEYPYPSPALQH